ncbi:MAG: hypothetical protein CVU38_14995 [Chloroflexi bacterium HGW-Chloroflexi-1]|nr:MAG: hypothetical protein CVU38_14995 [Chloroflexi bacterium HGW-Chloroflexi-1]
MFAFTHRRQVAIGMLLIMLLGVVAGCATPTPQAPAATVAPKIVEVTKEVPVTVAPKIVEVTKEVPVTVAAPAGKKEVRIARCGWLEAEIPLDRAIATYNNLPERAQDNVQIILDPAGKAPGDPLLAQMRKDGTMVWNGYTCDAPFLGLEPAVLLENVIPIEPYIQASQYVTAAQRIKEQMFPSVWTENSYQGKLYALPLVTDVVIFMYRKDYLAAVGYTAPPKTWDEVLDAAKKVQEKFGSEGVFGFAPTPAVLWRYIASLHQAFSPPDKLFTPEGLPNIKDPGFIKAMEVTKQFVDAGVVPAGWETWGYPETWKMGKLAMALNQHSMGAWGGMIWGYDKLAIVPIPPGPGIEKAGTMFWSSVFELYNGGPYPQETMDFMVWLSDPDNALWQPGLFKAGKISAYASAYDKFINPDDVTQNWALGVRDLLQAATAAPNTKWYITVHSMFTPHFVKYLKGDETAEAAVNAAWDEIQAEMKK